MTKVQEALKLAQEKVQSDNIENVVIDGEFQFDAAIVPSVVEKKRLALKFKETLMCLSSQVLKQVTLAIKLHNV